MQCTACGGLRGKIVVGHSRDEESLDCEEDMGVGRISLVDINSCLVSSTYLRQAMAHRDLVGSSMDAILRYLIFVQANLGSLLLLLGSIPVERVPCSNAAERELRIADGVNDVARAIFQKVIPPRSSPTTNKSVLPSFHDASAVTGFGISRKNDRSVGFAFALPSLLPKVAFLLVGLVLLLVVLPLAVSKYKT